MKYLLVILGFFMFSTAFAQDYATLIASHRDKYKSDFLTDQGSPLKKADLEHLHFYDVDSTYRVMANVEVLPSEKKFQMPTFDGDAKEHLRYARLTFTLKGVQQQLIVYKSVRLLGIAQYKDYLFLPFTDETNGSDTYGGGRYIDLNLQDIKDGKLELDFNKAYNPYCAYSAGYQCPKPPEENNLKTKIEAGEKQFTGGKKH